MPPLGWHLLVCLCLSMCLFICPSVFLSFCTSVCLCTVQEGFVRETWAESQRRTSSRCFARCRLTSRYLKVIWRDSTAWWPDVQSRTCCGSATGRKFYLTSVIRSSSTRRVSVLWSLIQLVCPTPACTRALPATGPEKTASKSASISPVRDLHLVTSVWPTSDFSRLLNYRSSSLSSHRVNYRP